MVNLNSPREFGGDLRRFAEGDLFNLLSGHVCGDCTMPSREDCDDCQALAVLGHLENQIGEAGIRFMKELVEQWS